jgi:hypothetical protein
MSTLTPAERDATLRAMWADPKKTAEEIAEVCGMSRGWVFSRRARMKLPRRPRGGLARLHFIIPEDPPPVADAIPVPVPACPETVADWLYAEWLQRGHRHEGALERLNALAPRGRYIEANLMRRAHGLSPFAPTPGAFA